MDDGERSSIAVAKEEAASALEEWLKAMKAVCERLSNERLDRADQARIAWKVAEKKLAEIKERERQNA